MGSIPEPTFVLGGVRIDMSCMNLVIARYTPAYGKAGNGNGNGKLNWKLLHSSGLDSPKSLFQCRMEAKRAYLAYYLLLSLVRHLAWSQ